MPFNLGHYAFMSFWRAFVRSCSWCSVFLSMQLGTTIPTNPSIEKAPKTTDMIAWWKIAEHRACSKHREPSQFPWVPMAITQEPTSKSAAAASRSSRFCLRRSLYKRKISLVNLLPGLFSHHREKMDENWKGREKSSPHQKTLHFHQPALTS